MLTIEHSLIFTAAGRFLILAGVLLVVGAACCTWIAPARALRRPVLIGGLFMIAGALVQSLGQLVAFGVFTEFAEPFADTAILLSGTAWGKSRGVLLGLALFVTVVSCISSRQVFDRALRVLALFAILIVPQMGHAAAASNVVYAVTVTAVHTAAASIWLGTLFLLAPSWWRGTEVLISALPRYGKLALFVAPLALLSGVLLGFERIDSISQILSSTYGRILFAKVLTVIAVLLLGARHHLKLSRSSPSSDALYDGAQSAKWTLVGELFLALLVLALTGWLAESEFPAVH